MTPSEKFKKPVIGTIQAQITGTVKNAQGQSTALTFPVDTFEVIEILTTPQGENIYLCNQWYKPGIPQQVPAFLVTKFTRK